MGTRNLTVLVSEGEIKIAQYGQWDGYPDYMGINILKFLREFDVEIMKKQVKNVIFVDENKQKEIDLYLKEIGSTNGYLNNEQSDLYNEKYKFLNRSIGSDILEMVYDEEYNKPMLLNNSITFSGDSLFCEWAYVIDLDKNLFEVYEGFNKNELNENDRFFKYTIENEEYRPIKLKKEFPLNVLPSDEEFLTYFKEGV
jgi:hypothetical protein